MGRHSDERFGELVDMIPRSWLMVRAMIAVQTDEADLERYNKVVCLVGEDKFVAALKMLLELDIYLSELFGPDRSFSNEQFVCLIQDDVSAFHECNKRGIHYSFGRVFEFERKFGRLVAEENMGLDTPSHGELILQGFNKGLAVRTPEYHLAEDVCYLHACLLEEVKELDRKRQEKQSHNSMVSQTLARTTIVTVYNLLEATINGLAAEWKLKHPQESNPVLDEWKKKNYSLKYRFVRTAKAVSGKSPYFDTEVEPLKSLFGGLKRRRDYIVHCEPDIDDVDADKAPREHRDFHDIPLEVVEETIDKAIAAIRMIWPHARGHDYPSWIPQKQGDGTYRPCYCRKPVDESVTKG